MRCTGCGANAVASSVCAFCGNALGPPPPAEAQAAALADVRRVVRDGDDDALSAALAAWTLPDSGALAIEALGMLLRIAASQDRRPGASLLAYDLLLPQLELLELSVPSLSTADQNRVKVLRRKVHTMTDPVQAASDTRLGLIVFALLGLAAAATAYGIWRLLLAWIEGRANG